MRKKIIVLGAGLVGKAIALDLADEFDVVSADSDDNALQPLHTRGISTQKFDFCDAEALAAHVAPHDLVIGAVPGFMGFENLKTLIACKKNVVDISFFAEDPFLLDDMARKNGVTVVTDCGVAPGMGNIILGYHNKRMRVHTYECMVGGLPRIREWPYEYKAVFSPIDVIQEYTRPARYIQNGALVVKEALSDIELIHVDSVGTLESWNSDGLGTLVSTMSHIPNMIEKTLRYPGSSAYLRMLRETGFFGQQTIDVKGTKIRPLDVTAALLFPKWKLKAGEKEFTVMRIRIEGEEQGEKKKYRYDLFDQTDEQSGVLSMARTTGYTCTGVARLLLQNAIKHTGIIPPEHIGEHASHFQFIIEHLRKRNVIYNVSHSS